MAKQKQSALDKLGRGLRELFEELERLLNPPQPKRARVPVPVPVRPPQRRNPYQR